MRLESITVNSVAKALRNISLKKQLIRDVYPYLYAFVHKFYIRENTT